LKKDVGDDDSNREEKKFGGKKRGRRHKHLETKKSIAAWPGFSIKEVRLQGNINRVRRKKGGG